MQVIADLQIHSKYARAVSPEMVLPKIWQWAKRKGIGLVATGDWTHPLWMREIKANLIEAGNGLLSLKNADGFSQNDESVSSLSVTSKWEKEAGEGKVNPQFLLATEVSCIYSQGGKSRRIHILIWSPNIFAAEAINRELFSRGANLIADGRPILGLTSRQVAEIVFSIEPMALIIPAHAWTPWFSIFGSESGFDSIAECFGDYDKYISAVETGLSSSPSMNWRIKELDGRSIVSFSDAHSGPKLGREATVFDLDDLSYKAVREAILGKKIEGKVSQIAYTIEFYPEEGKYHFTGHRNCNLKQSPEETTEKGIICPVCGKRLTVGVMHRVEELAGRSEEKLKLSKKLIPGIKVKGIYSGSFPGRPPYIMMVPLQEILAEAIGGTPTSQNVQNEYIRLTDQTGGEFAVLLKTDIREIAKISGSRVAEAIDRVRQGEITVDPGYDGVFGTVKIWPEKEEKKEEGKKDQLSLF